MYTCFYKWRYQRCMQHVHSPPVSVTFLHCKERNVRGACWISQLRPTRPFMGKMKGFSGPNMWHSKEKGTVLGAEWRMPRESFDLAPTTAAFPASVALSQWSLCVPNCGPFQVPSRTPPQESSLCSPSLRMRLLSKVTCHALIPGYLSGLQSTQPNAAPLLPEPKKRKGLSCEPLS